METRYFELSERYEADMFAEDLISQGLTAGVVRLPDSYEVNYYDASGVREECIASGEHFKRIQPSGGNDLCFNCGGRD